ncbi:RNA-binding domain-containing protein [Xylaria bambusicola]|uniref:RNA-binding domain-containing protein n=1 Tax=Xylaria bambusicola TaxID=326684 RepID=UPI0020074D58|nr:RNA-binding domain-containing protein [Xylaria bambusicola]KAI0502905.1 RNA-binding domain-containing protein [Xylaria bambusicola]
MDGFNSFNGKPASNGSGSQGDAGSQGAPGVNPAGLPIPPANGQGGSEMAPVFQNDSARQTLWMGELAPWMDENFIRTVYNSAMNENVQVKIIRDRHSGNAGYCFVEFSTPEGAQKALQLNGSPIPNTDRLFRLNWASGGGLVDRRDDRSPEYSIFVGDLGHEVNEFVLVALFQNRFPSCKSAKIMTDQQTGQSRGYGFVRFSNEEDQQRALTEMQGVYCGNRPMRVSPATPKNRGHQGNHYNQFGGAQQMVPAPQAPHHGAMGGAAPWMAQPQQSYGYQPAGTFNPMAMNQFTDPNNTTVFVGGLSGYVTEDELRSFFQGFGEITYVKIPPGKGCGFVQFVHRHAAEMAINQMQGYPIGNSRVRLSWGRSQNNSGVGTPYRPAPPPPHYFPPGPTGPAGPPGPGAFGGAFGGSAHQGPPGGLGPQDIMLTCHSDPSLHILHHGVLRFWRYGPVNC